MGLNDLKEISIVSTTIFGEESSNGCNPDCGCDSHDEIYQDESRNSGKTHCRCDSHCSCDTQCSCDSNCSCESNSSTKS